MGLISTEGPLRKLLSQADIGVLARLAETEAKVQALQAQMDEIRGAKFAPIVYEAELPSRFSALQNQVSTLQGQVGTLRTQVDEVRANYAPIVYETEIAARVAAWMDQNLAARVDPRIAAWADANLPGRITTWANANLAARIDQWMNQNWTTLMTRIQEGLSGWVELQFNTYTNYLYNTGLFEDTFADTVLSVRDLAMTAGRFRGPFVGSAAAFKSVISDHISNFNLLRTAADGMRGAFEKIQVNFRGLRDAMGYLRDAMDHGIVITGYSERMAALFEAFFRGGTWAVIVRNFLGQVVYESPTVSFTGVGVDFDNLRSYMGDSSTRFLSLRDRNTTFQNTVRARLAW